MTVQFEQIPVLPLRDIVVFPSMLVPLFVGRSKSIAALEKVMEGNKEILLLTQKDPNLEDLSEQDLYSVGTVGTVLQLLKLPDGTVKVLVEGKKRVSVQKVQEEGTFFSALIDRDAYSVESLATSKEEALVRSLHNQFSLYAKLNKKTPEEVLVQLSQLNGLERLLDAISANMSLSLSQKQKVLEIFDLEKRAEHILSLIESEFDVLQVEKKLRSRVKQQMEKTQRDYYLNEQMRAIQKELQGEETSEFDELEEKIKKTKFSKEAKKKATGELRKLKSMSPMSAEAGVVRGYLDWLLSVPWKKSSKVKTDLVKAQKALDQDHYGLDEVKERALEYLAVQSRSQEIKGPILCLVGPPGVGKTSLGKSLASATGRKFVRLSLGGVHDESEIRGHRRTYIGSMPGKIIQAMKKAGTSNPLILLDEIDKLGTDHRGDPSSALLEVLDPEQNKSFVDHYLEVEYDLSQVLFVTTANSLNMQRPLLDRLEVIRIPGYTEAEKLEIAERYLVEKQRKENHLKADEWYLEDSVLRDLVRHYTRESGVRSLEREIGKLARKAVKEIATTDKTSVSISAERLPDYLGSPKFHFGRADEHDQVGIVTGLAWTQVGGDILTIEAVKVPGKGKVVATGQLGSVMKESIQAAESFVKSRAELFGIPKDTLENYDIHVHVPEGATPKDGPSAGIAMVTAIVSVLTDNPISKEVAMTGEVTLRGRVLAIGGLKEKLLAALRGGIRKVFIPQENEKDLAEVPQSVKDELEIIPVSHVSMVLEQALVEDLKPLAPASAVQSGEAEKGIVAH